MPFRERRCDHANNTHHFWPRLDRRVRIRVALMHTPALVIWAFVTVISQALLERLVPLNLSILLSMPVSFALLAVAVRYIAIPLVKRKFGL